MNYLGNNMDLQIIVTSMVLRNEALNRKLASCSIYLCKSYYHDLLCSGKVPSILKHLNC